MENRYRHNRISLRFSDDEFFILKEKMRLSGEKSMNSFFRKLLLRGYVYQIDMSEYMTFNTHLSRIDSSLNQIARRVNATGNLYKDDIAEIRKDMEEIWHILKSIRSKIRSENL